MIDWDRNKFLVEPTLDPYTCKTSALIPPPSDVRNFTMDSATVVVSDGIIVNVSWLRPLDPNGNLSFYQLCVSPSPLDGLQSPTHESTCLNISVSGVLLLEQPARFLSLY